MINAPFQIHQAGDTAIVVEFGEQIASQINSLVLDYSEQIGALELPGVVETVPTFRSLLIQYDPDIITTADLVSSVESLSPASRHTSPTRRQWTLPVCYEGGCALDLALVAEQLGKTVNDIIDQHSAMNYDVFMLGFLPGQPYLGEINEGLRLPRRTSPRLRIPAGSVGIATSLTCVFPSQTPCGWHIIGRSPIPMWNMDQEQSPLFAPGDRVRLEPIGLSAFERLSLAVTHEGFRLSPDHGSALCLAH